MGISTITEPFMDCTPAVERSPELSLLFAFDALHEVRGIFERDELINLLAIRTRRLLQSPLAEMVINTQFRRLCRDLFPRQVLLCVSLYNLS